MCEHVCICTKRREIESRLTDIMQLTSPITLPHCPVYNRVKMSP